MPEHRQLRATALGFGAVLLWAVLALFTTFAAGLPPFQLLTMTFAVAAGLGVIKLAASGSVRALKQPLGAYLVSVLGLFGYHAFYFIALGNAPAVDASLIAYLWPLLIVVFSALLPGERLRWFHLAGALLGLFGAGLLVTGGGSITFRWDFALGYGAAFACALTWSCYSVINRRFGRVPTDAVGGFCALVAGLGLVSHLLFETTVVPNLTQGLAALALGLGPVGLAFFLWDYATKHGRIQLLGASAYAAPVLSTLVLIAFGKAEASWYVFAACVLVVGGAVLAAKDLFRPCSKRPGSQKTGPG